MRKAIIAALAVLCVGATFTLSLPQTAQARPGVAGEKAGRHAGGKRLQKLADALGLTDAQKAQIKPIVKDAAQQAKAVRQDTTLSPADKKAKMKAIRETMKSQIMPLLTPDQKAKMAEMRGHHGKRG